MVGIPNQNAFITNDVVQNCLGAGMSDYTGFAWAYDNHLGTVIAPPTFRQTDHGIPFLSLVYWVNWLTRKRLKKKKGLFTIRFRLIIQPVVFALFPYRLKKKLS